MVIQAGAETPPLMGVLHARSRPQTMDAASTVSCGLTPRCAGPLRNCDQAPPPGGGALVS
jgi:hypothetical protein